MRYVLVNGRTPFGRFACAECGEAIGNFYLREMSTQLYYCDPTCHANHCNNAVVMLANRAKAALVGLAPIPRKRSAGDEQTVST
jgi:hypothetical protein